MDTLEGTSPRQVVVVSGSYGAGHDKAADELAERLRREGHTVRRLDVADELPWRIGALLRTLYFLQLRLAPALWGSTLRRLEGGSRLARAARWGLGVLGRPLVRRLQDCCLVVSTHPFASQLLGEGRRRDRLPAPVVTYLTDPSVHPLWVHEDVDLHLAIHAGAAEQARAWGAVTCVIDPLVPTSEAELAPTWEPPWPPAARVALVTGGSCGVGELEASATDLLGTGLVVPVVLCGTNDRLRARLEAVAGVVALGWRSDVGAMLRAAGCVVQNAGGMSSLEALAVGVPTLTYRPIPGHGVTNAAALEVAGLAPWARTPEALAAFVAAALDAEHLPRRSTAPSVVDTLQRHLLLPTVHEYVAA